MASTDTGNDGQPRSEAFNWESRADRGTDELIGICRGILADGVLVYEEATFIANWLDRNPPVRATPWGKQLHRLLADVLADGRLDADEETALVEVLMRFIGGTPADGDQEALSYSTTLPLDDPEPSLTVEGQSFCFTGKFRFGTRTVCEKAAMRLGGVVHPTVRKDTDYLVIRAIGSRDWIHSSMGRKIEKAMQMRASDGTPHIISEDLLTRFVCNHTHDICITQPIESAVAQSDASESSEDDMD